MCPNFIGVVAWTSRIVQSHILYFLIAVEDTCPDGFEEFNSSCYYVNPNFQLNDDGAVSYCTGHDENAHLASILVSTGSSRVILGVALAVFDSNFVDCRSRLIT